MIPREILKKIWQIEIRTNRIVTETLAGASGFNSLEFDGFGSYGEFATIKLQEEKSSMGLALSNSAGLKTLAAVLHN